MNESAAPAADTAPLGLLSTLAGIYAAPVPTFRAVASRPRFLAPLLGLVLLNVAFTFVWTRKADPVEVIRTQLEDTGRLEQFPPDEQTRIIERQARIFPLFAWLGPVVFAPLIFVALAALFLFVYRFFYASEATFAQSLAVVGWTLFAIGLVTTPLTLLVMALKGEWSVDPRTVIQASPAALVDRTALAKPLYVVLDALDVFSAWSLFLFTAGYAAAARRPLGSAAVGVLVLWAIYLGAKVAMAALF